MILRFFGDSTFSSVEFVAFAPESAVLVGVGDAVVLCEPDEFLRVSEVLISVFSVVPEMSDPLDESGVVELAGSVEVLISGALELEGSVEVLISGALVLAGSFEALGFSELSGALEVSGTAEVSGEFEAPGLLELFGEALGLGLFELIGDELGLGIPELFGEALGLGLLELLGVALGEALGAFVSHGLESPKISFPSDTSTLR